MEEERAFPRLPVRDRVVTVLALAFLISLSWVFLVRAPDHSHHMTPPGVASASPVPPPQTMTEVHASAPEESEEDDVPRFP